MSEVKQVQATLIGDVLGSRRSSDRALLHETLAGVLASGNASLAPVSALRVTVGDEFQGTFATVGAALHAALWLRLHLVPVADLRHGVGWGRVEVLAPEPRVEDGPGWWAAREAIEHVKDLAARPATRTLRTAYRRSEEPDARDGADPLAVNAALTCRDQVLGSVDGRSAARTLRLLRGSLDGLGQHELAAQEGISASAVSQRFRRDGLGAVLAAEELMRGI
ncbi:MAG: sigma-70 region 4 type 2 [Marmoricola sp.]|nr:sigma-70 region 4 type 2 [Marmoricola sp.]